MKKKDAEEVVRALRKERSRQNIKDYRITVEDVLSMELLSHEADCDFYAKVGRVSYYAWIEADVIRTQMFKRKH